MLLKELTRLPGVSGYEDDVRAFIFEECKKYADETYIDTLGSVIAIKKGSTMPEKSVMVCAHMDEVGFIIRAIEDNGMLRFGMVGGVDTRILLSSRVLLGDNMVPGIIGSKAIHLQEPDERKVPVPLKNLYIDIGARSRAEAEALVSVGDIGIFDDDYLEFGEGMIKSRALDDRVGCALLLDALKESWPVTLYAVFSCQEEVGSRGASAATYVLQPDVAIALEGTTCADMHGVPEHLKVTTIGGGAVVAVMEASTIANRALVDFMTDLADSAGITWQYRRGASGGTDASVMQLSAGSRPVAHIMVPCRYLHSPASVVSRRDVENAAALLKLTLAQLPEFISKGEY